MNRNLVRALLSVWDRPAFRDGVRHLVDLDEVTALLAALAAEDGGDEVDLRVMGLLRSALETTEIRRAVLLLVDTDDVRQEVSSSIAEGLADRPDLARSIVSALGDPAVRAELTAALESARLREAIWRAADNQLRGRRWKTIGELAVVLARHRHARRLVWLLKRHGVLRALRR
ncbi:hypothetical protein [Asanoa iriomotensis]|uniref:HEAT repeat domain-containing protein n=1 Tax=Asanoa iriomotensis TaxID=234613 RepID=A0ABQ4BYR4_9ACTN|nr:hypothetical protein [Asanoa iriomotensis]GIF55684.1 hypothetical protein Air01nite_17790 [Asanoa iriomotensis]